MTDGPALEDLDQLRTVKRYSKTLVNVCAVLRCFTVEERVLGITELKRKAKMPLSSVSAYLYTLCALGYVEQTRDRKYLLSLRASGLGLAALSATGMPELARGPMARLRDDTGYTVGLAVLDGLEAVYVHRVAGMRPGSSMLDLDGQPGLRLPALRTAAGRVLLANLSEDARETLSFGRAVREAGHLEGLITPELREQFGRIRREGHAREDHERPGGQGLAGVAIPVRGITGEVLAALDMTAKKPLVQLIDLTSRLRVAGGAISERLGASRPHDHLPDRTMERQ